MVEKKKEEVKQLLAQSVKLSDQIENLYNDLSIASTAIENEIIKINDARVKILMAKQTLLRLLRGI